MNENQAQDGGVNSDDVVKVSYINANGGGFQKDKYVPAGTTIATFFSEHSEVSGTPSSYTIRVNREGVVGSYELQNGDMITISPVKVAGA